MKKAIIRTALALVLITCCTTYGQVGLSIHIASNNLDPEHYCKAELLSSSFPENYAKQMCGLADRMGFKSKLFLGKQATCLNILAALDKAAATLNTGDIFLLTFCGHGGQLDDKNGDETDDHKDETWCLYDQMLVDDVLQCKWAKFKKGVRVLIIMDCCHSATNFYINPVADKVQGLTDEEDDCTYEKNKAAYDKVLSDSSLLVDIHSCQASFKIFTACRDDQTTINGNFSQAILNTMQCDFLGNYEFYNEYLKHILNPYTIEPQYNCFGEDLPYYNNENPFHIP